MIARQVQIEAFGQPVESVRVVEVNLGELDTDDVLVEMHYSPVNPADLNLIEGTYGIRPQLPAVPGNEGAGIVLETGADVTYVKPGDRVLLFSSGNWRSHHIVPETDLLRLPSELDLRQAAMLKVNPLTAWMLLHHFVTLEPGEPVLQNAANSGVGRSVIQVSRELGFKTINMVRREELIPELMQLGATEVLLDEQSSYEQIQQKWTDISLGLNAVGGDSALRVASCLQPDGWMITYGAMGRKPVKLPNSFLIFRNLHITGFWVNRWMQSADLGELREILGKLALFATEGKLTQPVQAEIPMAEVAAALGEAAQPSRNGKILIDLRSAS